MFVQLHLQSAPVKNQMLQFDCILTWRCCRLVHSCPAVNSSAEPLSSGLNNGRRPKSLSSMLPSVHTQPQMPLVTVRVVCTEIPPPVNKRHPEGRGHPTLPTLFSLQLAITGLVSDWTLEQKGMICLGMRKWQWICSALSSYRYLYGHTFQITWV